MQGSLRIQYELDSPTAIHLAVYDVSGRMRAVVAEGIQAAGAHEAWWNLDRLESGVYFVKLRAKGPALVRRVVVMH